MFLILLAQIVQISASLQKVNISGQVVCEGKPMVAKVFLMEYDFYNWNDILNETTSDNQGNFHVSGEEDETLTIEPFLQVVHTCQTKPNCFRTQQFAIPKYLIGKDRGGFVLEVKKTESWHTNQCNNVCN